MSEPSVFREPVTQVVLCAAVGGLAAFGLFSSVAYLPLVFGGVSLVFGLLSLRHRPEVAPVARRALVLLAPVLALAGFLVHARSAEESLRALQEEVAAALVGTAAPRLTGLELLEGDAAELEAAIGYSRPATVVTFWARWCSPCWTELPELDDLYRQRSGDGLAVVAVTRFDDPDDAEARREQIERDRKVVRRHDLSFPTVITAAEEPYRVFEVRSLPSSFLVDDDGRILAVGIGVEGGRQLMRRAVELLDGG